MTLTIYWGSGSPVSWRALLALELKGLPYQSHQLQLSEKEHRSEKFLALSPRGTFPILVDGEQVVRDSLAILAYLEFIKPDPPLLGSTAAEVADIWRHIREHEDFLGNAVQTITRAFFRKAGITDEKALSKALECVPKELGLLNQRLLDSEWLVGDRVTAADIVYYPTMHRLLRASTKLPALEHGLPKEPLADFAAIRSWLERMEKLPGVEATYPPHWREAAEEV